MTCTSPEDVTPEIMCDQCNCHPEVEDVKEEIKAQIKASDEPEKIDDLQKSQWQYADAQNEDEQFEFLNDPNQKKEKEKFKKGVTFIESKEVIGGDGSDQGMDFGRESG